MVTLKQIAKEAGVSISTVSRVINQPNTSAASPQMRKRILEIAQQTGYIPNPVARELQRASMERRPIYGLIACPSEEVRDDPFFSIILSSVEKEAQLNNFILQYTYTPLELSENENSLEWDELQSANLIVIGRFDQALYDLLKRQFKNIAYVGLNNLDADCDQVLCDGFCAARDAVLYLNAKNHQKIGFIGADVEGRQRGYLEGMRLAELPVEPNMLLQTETLSMDGGFESMNRILDMHTDLTAVIAANDMTAIGALQACKERGVRVPEDISLMGINDIPNVRYVQPELTTVHAPLEEMGRQVVRLLIDRIQGGHELPVKALLPYHIVERESCLLRPEE